MEPSYVQEVPICWTSTESAKLWLYWRKMTGTARNTVRRFQRDIPHKGHHGRAWRAMEANLEAVRKLFYDCRGNCSAMLRFMKDAISMEPPGLRTLQKFCTPFRLELLQSRLTKTERFETPPGHQMQIDFGEDDVCVSGEKVRVHFFVAKLSYSRRIFAKAYFSENQVNWLDGIESAFRFFDGVPREIVCDNAKTLVKDHMRRRTSVLQPALTGSASIMACIP